MNAQIHSFPLLIPVLFLSSLTGCGGNGDSVTSPSGITVSLPWSPAPDPTISAYDVQYGMQSLSPPGDCIYSDSIRGPAILTPATLTATVTGLAPNISYCFVVTAYNGLSGAPQMKSRLFRHWPKALSEY